MSHPYYESPFCSRYASKEMQAIFSPDKKFTTWRKLWVALAKAEKELGLPITEKQIEQMQAHVMDINYEDAERREKQVRHDVMAHIYAFGLQCEDAKGIIHWGATSCYVGDNTDLIIMKEGLALIKRKLVSVIALLSKFADQYKEMPCLGYTHLQPAQLTTVGKRASLWLQDFVMDYRELEDHLHQIPFLGSKGTTGTQASFLELFHGDYDKVQALDEKIAKEMGFSEILPVSGQTYSRKIDYFVLSVLCGIAQSAMKLSNDIRILQSFKELEEPFEKSQIGSSAMPYKRNPMRSERITSLARYVMVDCLNPAFTAGTQWFERTLDDSANKRISIAEGFLGTDAILNLLLSVCDGMVVYPKVIEKRVRAELPFMISENLLMEGVRQGYDRQQLHEVIRGHAMEAAKAVKERGEENDLLRRLKNDENFPLTDFSNLLDPKLYIGCCSEQVSSFLQKVVHPILEENVKDIGETADLSV